MYAQGLYEISRGWTTEQDWEARMRRSDTRSRAEAGPPGRYDRKNFAESNVYVGPALMLHEIRKKVGDAKFFALGRDWVQTQRNTQQDRASFIAFVNKHTGQNLTPVIDKWLDSPTTPS
jgi:aminopeptidase N